jgi:DNA-binding CsgD family transcriptional regulator
MRESTSLTGVDCQSKIENISGLAGQLTQRWTLSVWGPVARILADPPLFSHKPLESPRKPRGHGPLPRLRPEQVNELVQAYESGKSATELAREFGINQQTALDHLHRRGSP